MPGFIFYSGPSRLDGQPIVGIATYDGDNYKTGPMVQTWILRADIAPHLALRSGADSSVCGDCPLRANGCYVIVHQAPLAVWRAWSAGSYPELSADHDSILSGMGLRYGSYGDPVAVPRRAWSLLERLCTGATRTGYTHQWRQRRFHGWRTKLMASIHTDSELAYAQYLGWRTFRVLPDTDSRIRRGEILCPASPEAGQHKTCAECGACDGRRDHSDTRVSVAIVAHGAQRRNASSIALHVLS